MTQSIPLTQAPSHHLLQGIANATNRLCTVQDDDGAVQQALVALGGSAQVDRISVMENCAASVTGSPAMVQRWEWITPSYGMPGANVPAFSNRSYAQFWDRWLTPLRQGGLVVMAVQDCAGHERDLLLSQGLRSLLVVPIILRGGFWGAVRFDNYRSHRTWTGLEQSVLSTFGSTLGGAIVQRRDHARLRQQQSARLLQNRDAQNRDAQNHNPQNRDPQSHDDDCALPPACPLMGPGGASPDPSARLSDAEQIRCLRQEKAIAEQRSRILEQALQALKENQAHGLPGEEISETAQLAAGIARGLTPPLSLIHGNLDYASNYLSELLSLLALYDRHYPTPPAEVQQEREQMDLAFIQTDLPEILDSMREGSTRIVEIVRSLRTFSRARDGYHQVVDLHTYLNDALTILRIRMKGQHNIQVIRDYGSLPPVECYPGQLSQVFMNILSNAIDTLTEKANGRTLGAIPSDQPGKIHIVTQALEESVIIRITDTGMGISEEVQTRLFHPYFTTKKIGKGRGLGLAIAYQVITQRHKGTISCTSQVGQGTTFTLTLPIKLPAAPSGGEPLDQALDSVSETIPDDAPAA